MEVMNQNNPLNGLGIQFGQIKPGLVKLSMSGKLAVKAGNSYLSYDIKSGRLTDVTNFTFDLIDNMFFVVPCNKVEKGDIILIEGKPKCVINSNEKTSVEVMDYETQQIVKIVPRRHIFLGKSVFFSKIVSLFTSDSNKGLNQIMKMTMMSQMMGNRVNDSMNMNNFIPMMFMMNGNSSNIFDNIGDFFDDSSDIDDAEDASDDSPEVVKKSKTKSK